MLQCQAPDTTSKLRGVIEGWLGQVVGVSGGSNESEWIGRSLRSDSGTNMTRRGLKSAWIEHVAHTGSGWISSMCPVVRTWTSSNLVRHRETVGVTHVAVRRNPRSIACWNSSVGAVFSVCFIVARNRCGYGCWTGSQWSGIIVANRVHVWIVQHV